MNNRIRTWSIAAAAAAAGLFAGVAGAQDAARPDPRMSYFVTSAGPGDGANLGGLKGADGHCAVLAKAAGAKKSKWRAYLSTQPYGGQKLVNARDRIGKGPWYNFKGEMVAADLAELHSDRNRLSRTLSLTEKGAMVNGHEQTPNTHDILTGSQSDGTAFADGFDHTCRNWTSNDQGVAQVGHVDRYGNTPTGISWNNAHPSRGCSQAKLVASGGAGLLYCFAPD